MADHKTDRVLEAVAARITAAVSRDVFRGREFGVPDANLPATFVYLGTEDVGAEEEGATWPTLYPRTGVVTVEAADVVADIESTLLAMRRDTTKALRADHTLGLSWVIDIIEGSAEAIEYEAEGSVKAFYRCNWTVIYQRDWDDPTA